VPSVWHEKRRNKHGTNYIVRWEMTVNGKRLRGAESCGPSKRYMRKRKGEIREALYAGREPTPDIVVTGMAQFVQEVLSNSKRTKAAATHDRFDAPALQHFAKWFGNKPLGMIGPKTLIGWRDALFDDDLGPNTVRMRLRSLSAALGYAVTMNYLERNPFELLRKKGRRASPLWPPAEDAARYLSHAEVRKMLAAMLDTRKRFPALPRGGAVAARAAYFILHTGLRHDELLGLDWKMVHRPKAGPWTMEITRASAHGLRTGRKTKTRKSRIVEIESKAQEVMGEPKESGTVFWEWKTRSGMGIGLRRGARDAELGAVRAHDLRHTWATNFMYKTGNIFELMYRGGWSSIESAKVYQHVRKRDEPVEYPPFPHYFPTNAERAVPAAKA
jgi:integrase